MKNKQKQLNIKGKKQVKALEDLKLKDQIKSVQRNFPEVMEMLKLKMKKIKLKNMKQKSIATIWSIIQGKNHSILKHLKQ